MLAWAVLTLPQVTHATTPPPSRPTACTEILAGATQDVTAFGVCRKVTNSSSRKVCALTATNSLWTSWYTKAANGLVPGVSIASCVPNINGVCGSAHGVVSPTPPTANLCSAGTATTVVTGTVHSWSCNGSGTGTNASCQAPLNFATCPAQTVNWSQASNNCSASIAAMNHNATSTVNNSAMGYTGSVSLTCNNGNLTQSSASCTVPPAVCGSAHGTWLLKGQAVPSSNLCSSGTASAVTTNATSHSWTCTGSTLVNCSAGISNMACWGEAIGKSPVAVTLPAGVTSFSALAGGRFHSCGIGNNGRAYCWGQNWYGQLGDGTTTNSLTPVAVTLPAGVTSFTAVSAGGMHSCGFGNNGRAYCWGQNYQGELGDGTMTQRNTPTPVTLPTGVTSFSAFTAGLHHNCAIGNNGLAYCWGYNWRGRLGDGTMTPRTTPTLVALPSGITSFTSVSAGYDHTCGIGNNGRAYCWGSNLSGQLGDGTTTDSWIPTLVTLPEGVTSFSAVGGNMLSFHTCGIGNNGRVYCWGRNDGSQLGDGTMTQRNTPTPVTLPTGVTSFTALSGDWYHTCAIGNNGRAYCWGINWMGQLGDGTTTNSLTPVAVILPAGVTSFTSVMSSRNHSCALVQ